MTKALHYITPFITPQRIILLLIAGVLLWFAGNTAFTSATAINVNSAGSGSGAISGYTVTNVNYTLDGTDPRILDSFTFDINPITTNDLQVQVVSTGAWLGAFCTNTAGTVTCNVAGQGITIASMDQLSVVATD